VHRVPPRPASRPRLVVTNDTWFPDLADGATTLDRVVNHRPEYAAAMRHVEEALWAQDVVEPEILELCRLRIAQLLGAPDELTFRSPAAAGLDQALVDNLPQWPTSPLFDERLRACLGFAEQMVIDAQGVTDQDTQRLTDAVGEGGFLVLAYGCGFFETTQRARLLLARRNA
jgi:alkylhydroperoxidase family enzyme